jgi:hypothetical protein
MRGIPYRKIGTHATRVQLEAIIYGGSTDSIAGVAYGEFDELGRSTLETRLIDEHNTSRRCVVGKTCAAERSAWRRRQLKANNHTQCGYVRP